MYIHTYARTSSLCLVSGTSSDNANSKCLPLRGATPPRDYSQPGECLIATHPASIHEYQQLVLNGMSRHANTSLYANYHSNIRTYVSKGGPFSHHYCTVHKPFSCECSELTGQQSGAHYNYICTYVPCLCTHTQAAADQHQLPKQL